MSMSGHEMPLLAMSVDGGMHHVMDGAMALDDVDLFGDPVMDNALGNAGIDLRTRPPPTKQLQQRLDELRTRGCCQGIAWSRQGTIASVSKDGRSVDMRFLRTRPDNGSWELSESYPCPSSLLSNPISPIVHLAWAATPSPELAIIDALGRIMIVSFSISLNRPFSVRKWDSDPVDDLHSVVGCYWLPLAVPATRQFNIIYGPAVWKQSEYRYENYVTPAHGPWHPHPNKSALLCVTTNGDLKLMYHQNNNRLEETAVELESVTSSNDLITHAALCSEKNTLLIALATASKQLRIVRVQIQWGGQASNDRQAPPLSPVMKDKHLAVTTWLQGGPDEYPLDSTIDQLSHLEILSSIIVEAGNPATFAPPLVLAVRSHVPTDASAYNQECQSIIDRWEVVNDQPQASHAAFEQLGSKNGSSPSPTMTRLKKLEPVVIPKIIISIHVMELGRVVCFAFSDGTLQYRDRVTMNEVYTEHNTLSIMHPSQIGFHFTNETPALQVAFSPTNLSFAQICEDGDVKWNGMQYPMEDPNAALQGNQYNALIAILSVAVATAGLQQNTSSYDDVLALARPFTQKPSFMFDWAREVIRLVKTPVDYSEETTHDTLMRNTQLQLVLSILNHLGFHGDYKPRSPGGKFAMVGLAVRNISILITLAVSVPMSVKGQMVPLDEPEVVETLAGCSKWLMDLFAWLVDSLFQLMDDPTFMAILSEQKRYSELAGYLREHGDVSLHILLSSSIRGYLAMACRRLAHLEGLAFKAKNHYDRVQTQSQQQQADHDPSSSSSGGAGTSSSTATGGASSRGGASGAASRHQTLLFLAYVRMHRVFSSAIVKLQDFEKLLHGLSQDVRTSYQTTLSGLVAAKSSGGKPSPQQQGNNAKGPENLVKTAQSSCELDLLTAGNIPPPFRDVLLKLFSNTLPAFRSSSPGDLPSRLYFGDYNLLELEDNPRCLAARKASGKYVDIFKRSFIPGGGSGGDETAGTSNNTPVQQQQQGNGTNGAATGGGARGSGDGSSTASVWRRCARCASVMEDIIPGKAGFVFVLGQQRKCACAGNWCLVPRCFPPPHQQSSPSLASP